MQVLLVRHSQTVLDKTRPNRLRKLSDQGIEKAKELAQLSIFEGTELYITSPQLKATHTCVLIASQHPAPIMVDYGLDETTSVTNALIENFDEEMKTYLTNRDYCINQGETAQQTKDRMINTIKKVITSAKKQGLQKVTIVSHGTALSLFSSHFLKTEPYSIHRSINMPDVAIFDSDTMSFTIPFHCTHHP